MKILMLKGLPGSGKSTWAKQFVAQNPGWVRINKDSLRDMMGSYRPGKDESLILEWRDVLIRSALLRGKSVVVDDTNLYPKHGVQLRMIADNLSLGAKRPIEFEEKFFDTPLEQCIENDLKRPNSVGEKVIKKMWREFLARKVDKPTHVVGVPYAIICDLDGTIALHNGRSPYDVEKCDTDLPNTVVTNIVRSWLRSNSFSNGQLIFVSGREDKFREATTRWLCRHGYSPGDYLLFMRRAGDFRSDDVVKQEVFEQNIRGKFNVEFVLDDRNRVVDMWRRNGLTCLQVAEGDF